MNKNIFLLPVIVALILISAKSYSQENWYDSASVRIEQLRKGDFTIIVRDNVGDTLTDSIDIVLNKHEFPWGTIIPAQGEEDYQWSRAVAAKYFNYGVTGNIFKWPWIEPTQGAPAYTLQDEVLDWIEKVGFGFRGHALLWGGDASWQMPSWTLDTVALSRQDLYDACETHIRRDVDHFKGRVNQYDVVNEPSFGHETWLAGRVGDSINWNSFKWAKETDSSAQMFVNDYNIIVNNSAGFYKLIIQEMLDHGAPVEGIGVQAHMEQSINWQDIKTKLDTISKLGLPVVVTEFDMRVNEANLTQLEQAAEYAEMMRTTFSHPSVEGFIFWGLYDKAIYRAGSGLYTENRVPKIVADTVYKLIHEKWSTKVKEPASVAKEYNLRGFYGNYEVIVDFDGEVKKYIVPLTRANEDSVFILDYADGSDPSPEYTGTTLSPEGKQVRMHFNMKMNPESFYKEQFHFFSERDLTIDTIIVADGDSTSLDFILADTLKYRQFAAFYYDGDSATAVNSKPLGYVGPETIENLLPGFVEALTDTSGTKITVRFSREMQSVVPSTEFTFYEDGAELNVLSGNLDPTDAQNVIFELEEAVSYSSLITMNYSNGTYTAADGYLLHSFGTKYVKNNVKNPVVSIRSSLAGSLKVFPNPVSGSIYFEGISGVSAIELLNAEGKQISYIQTTGKPDIIIDTESFPSGIIIYRLWDSEQQLLFTDKFIKN